MVLHQAFPVLAAFQFPREFQPHGVQSRYHTDLTHQDRPEG